MGNVQGHVTHSNNIFSWDVSSVDLIKENPPVRSPLFSYKGCSWYIQVPRDKKRRLFAVLARDLDEGPEAITVSFSLVFRSDNGVVAEKPPELNRKFKRNGSSSSRFSLEGLLNMTGLRIVTIACHFLEGDNTQQSMAPQPKKLVDLNQEADALKKKLNDAESTIDKLREDIDDLIEEKESNLIKIKKLREDIVDLIEEKESNLIEIENMKKSELNLNQGIDVLKMKLNDAQLTNSKLRVYMDGLIEDKRSSMKEIENLKKLNEELELKALSADFEELLRSQNKSDVVLKVQGREFPAHKAVLMTRSSVFRATFSHDSHEEKTGVVTILDCDAESFSHFLNFLYSSRVGELTMDSAHKLYATSDKYDMPGLKSICSDHLIQNLTPESVCDVAVLADRHFDDGFASAVQLYFNENYASILQTSEWTATMKNNTRISDKLLKEMASVVGKKPAE